MDGSGSRGQDVVGAASTQGMGGTLDQTLSQGFGEMGLVPGAVWKGRP